MKSSEFIKENVKVQKPLRPAKPVMAEDDLDEIDRRGFLKGAGAAAAGVAGLGATKNAKAEEFGTAIQRMLMLHYICKDPDAISRDPSIKHTVCPRVDSSLKKFASRNDVGPRGKTSGKIILNSWYPDVKKQLDDMKLDDANGTPYNKYGPLVDSFIRAANVIISDFESLNEF